MNNIINKFHHGDAFYYFKMIENKSIDLTFTSLPDISQTPLVKTLRNTKNYKTKRVMKWQELLVIQVCSYFTN